MDAQKHSKKSLIYLIQQLSWCWRPSDIFSVRELLLPPVFCKEMSKNEGQKRYKELRELTLLELWVLEETQFTFFPLFILFYINMIIGVYTSKKLTSKYVFTNNLLIIKCKMHTYIGETYQIPFWQSK